MILGDIFDVAEAIGERAAEGAGWYDNNIVGGARQSAADAYLRPHLDRPNLTVVTSALVHRLIVAGTRCTGVEYDVAGQKRTVRADAEQLATLLSGRRARRDPRTGKRTPVY